MTEKHRLWVCRGMILTGIGFMILGAFRGETGTVLAKAIRICMECIGIG